MDIDILRKAMKMLEGYPLCDHCLGRQFALFGYGMENDERGKAIKLVLMLEAHALALLNSRESIRLLKILAINGFFEPANEMLKKMRKRTLRKNHSESCFLCENKFCSIEDLARNALKQLVDYEHSNFMVGIELPLKVEEREDEFKAEFEISHGESIRNEFGRVIGKKIAPHDGKAVEHKKPEVVVLINPFTEKVEVQANPLFIAGRYKKLVRGIPQSKWFCSNCRGKGCERCNWTGKMYPESVEEIIGKLFLDETGGVKTSFHASGREDIDARMLGKGRPFVIEISRPKKRFLDLDKLEKDVNTYAKDKVEVSKLRLSNKDVVRKLKKAESAQKEYRVIMEFENIITNESVRLLEDALKNAVVKQRTPTRVLHRRADLTREKYIYDAKVKVLTPRKAEMKVRCQGGLYIKELVTGDYGRTIPSVSETLKNKAKPIKLDVLDVIMRD